MQIEHQCVRAAVPTDTSTPHKQITIAAISERVTAESRETEDTADWISHATENEDHYDSSTDSKANR